MVNINRIFEIKTEKEFNDCALEVFQFQYEQVSVYHDFVNYLGKNPKRISDISEIPFLPIELFKENKILAANQKTDFYFQSSGTTGQIRSKHYVSDLNGYEKSIFYGFSQAFGNPKDFVFLGLLPNYLENPHSSLIYMVEFLMKSSEKEGNGYFLSDEEGLYNTLNELKLKKQKTILFGVSFALLDFVEKYTIDHPYLTVLETGGMKGRKTEITKKEVLDQLRKGFPTSQIASEYGMTELLSQAYALESLFYTTPPWMKMGIREIEDPQSWSETHKSGAINIIDLANVNSCSFIATSDLGRANADGKIEVIGRMDHSDLRGCSLLLS